MKLEEYLKNPCAALSIPYWKAKNIIVPDNMMIVHDRDFDESYLNNYTDEKYFRLYHNLKNIDKTNFDGFEVVTSTKDDIKTIVNLVNKSYDDMQASYKQFKNYTRTSVYNPDLWILIKEKSSNHIVGCGIADFDNEAKELILEWIQVLPEYRRKGIGRLIVNELLNRSKNIANFATVSGKVDNSTKPELLYRKCGFVGNDIWHILCETFES